MERTVVNRRRRWAHKVTCCAIRALLFSKSQNYPHKWDQRLPGTWEGNGPQRTIRKPWGMIDSPFLPSSLAPSFSSFPWGKNSTKHLVFRDPGFLGHPEVTRASACPWQSLGGNQVFSLSSQPVLNGTDQQTVTLPLAVRVLIGKWSRLVIQLITPKHSFPPWICVYACYFAFM